MLTPERLKAIKERCERATKGPWRVGNPYVWAGVNDGSHPNWTPPPYIGKGECALCHLGKPVATVKDKHGQSFHVHRDPNYDSDPRLYGGYWNVIVSESTYEEITGHRDSEYEEGGVCSKPEDAEFIAHAREDVPALVAEVERLQELKDDYRLRIEHMATALGLIQSEAEVLKQAIEAAKSAGGAERLDEIAKHVQAILDVLGRV